MHVWLVLPSVYVEEVLDIHHPINWTHQYNVSKFQLIFFIFNYFIFNWFFSSTSNNWIKRFIKIFARHITTWPDIITVVGKLASPCGTIRVPPHSTHIIDGQSPSHLVPGKVRQLGPDLSQTTAQKDEWFV